MKNCRLLNPNRARIYLLFTRNPLALILFEEVETYTNGDDSALGLIVRDKTDNSFNCSILTRGKSGQFKAVKNNIDIEKIEIAKNWIDLNISSDLLYKHEDEEKFDLFDVIVSEDKIHPHFQRLDSNPGLSSAKEALKEISYHYDDIDGNFLDQFQSINGFDARLWELFLFSLFREQQFTFDRNHEAPDYFVEKMNRKLAIEAVTIGRNQESLKNVESFEPPSQEVVFGKLENEMPLKFGSALFDKMKKEYWKKEHIQGVPFVIAIADFHEGMSMTWSSSAIEKYLYGFKYEPHYDQGGNLIVKPIKINSFKKENGTEIPAGFFFQPNSENVSAIIFSSAGTISKFNRMGKQAGLGSEKLSIRRYGLKHDHDKNASKPLAFNYIVSDDGNESWSEGVSVYHNPNAKIPLDPNLFDDKIAQHMLIDNLITSILPEFYPYSNITMNMVSTDEI